MLTRFWIRFELIPYPTPLNLGCGVTARDLNDALKLVAQLFPEGELPQIQEVTPNVDISTLDAGHVRPNMGNIFPRGIWWPLQ